ncbi:MAG TPA: O-antigen ligase family protein [Verrucomicrobiae bacterium]
MTSNPAAALRMLITYAICVPVAILLGYTLTDVGNNPNYSNLFIVGLIVGFLLLPVLLKWHYPIMVLGLGCPITMFFLKGSPPLSQVVVIISLGIAIVERAANSQKRFISAPSMTWAMIFTAAIVLFTAKMTGGIGLHTLGGDVGGGKKYIVVFLGVATYFALTSRVIPKQKRGLYVALFLLAGLPAFLGDLSALMPSPLSYLGLLIRPSISTKDGAVEIGVTRMGAFATSASVVAGYLLAKYGIRGIFSSGKAWWRLPFFLLMLTLSFLGGFRNIFLGFVAICSLLFFMEGLHRTRLLPIFLFIGLICASLIVPLAGKLPFTFQRVLSVVPLVQVSQEAKSSAEGSSEWRLRIWRELWPQVPGYLLLGKGYALTADDMTMMGRDSAFAAEGQRDASQEALAISGDYHSGPLSTLIPFGLWGGISIIWIALAGWRILYRNYKYGDPELRTVNAFFLAGYIWHVVCFCFIFGAYGGDVTSFAATIGFSLALNGGICRPQPGLQPNAIPQTQSLPLMRPQLT